MRWLPALVVLGAVALYFVRISDLTLLVHERMKTMTSDLAEFDNLFFNAYQGRPFRAPCIAGDLEDWSALKIHAELVLYLLLPLYAIKPGAQTLLVIQTGVVALTAIPVYLLAARRLGRGWMIGATACHRCGSSAEPRISIGTSKIA